MSKGKDQKITKDDLTGRGIVIKIGEEEKKYTMKSSWHYPEHFQFAEKEDYDVDLKKKVKKGDFVSIGHRQIEPENPIDVEGEDVVHWNVALEDEDNDIAAGIKKVFKDRDIKSAKGWDQVPKEQKLKYLEMLGLLTEAEKKQLEGETKAFTGANVALCGGFDDKAELEQLITENGGKVSSNFSKGCNVLILGRSWVTKTRNKIGKGSPKHKAAVKAKALIVKKSWVQKSLDTFKKTKVPALKQDHPTAEEMEAESEDEQNEQNQRDEEAKTAREEREKLRKEKEKEKKKEKSEKPKEPVKRKRPSTKEDEADEDEPAEKKQKKAIPEAKKLRDMKRADLQKVAKEHGVKANLQSDEIIKELKKLAEKQK